VTILARAWRSARLVLAPDHEAGDVLQEQQGDRALIAELDEVGALQGRLAEQHAVVGDDPDGVPVHVREAGHEGGAVLGLELREAAAVDEAGDDLPHVVGRARIGRDDPEQLGGVVRRLLDRDALPGRGGARAERRDDPPDDAQRVRVVVGEVVGHPGRARVQPAATELLRGDDLPGGRLHQRRAAQEDRPLVRDDDRLVGHGRDVRAARGAAAQHRGDLGDALRAHRRLVEEDAAEVVAVGEHLVLRRQEGAAGVDEVHARQAVLQRHLLRPQVLLHRHRVVGAALDRGVVRHDDALAARHPADPGDQARPGRLVAVQPVRRQRRQLEEAAARVEQRVDAVARAGACRG
jgi:hypothetical protein